MTLATMTKAKPVRQIDIARQLGVSRALVASCLNNPEGGERKYPVSPETERRIKEIAAQLGYRRSPMAAGLRAGKSFLVGVLNSGVNFWLHNELNAGIQRVLTDHEYAPLTFIHQNGEEENHFIEMCLHRRVDGLLANCDVDARGAANARPLADLHEEGRPVVEIFGHFIPNAPSVAFDHQTIAALAVRTLLARGYRDIVLWIHDQYQAGKKSGLYWTARELWQGYLAACKEHRLSPRIVTHPLPGSLTDERVYYEDVTKVAGAFGEHAAKPVGIVGLGPLETEALLDVLLEQSGENAKIHAICLGAHHRSLRLARHLTLIPAPSRQVGVAASQLLLRMMSDADSGDRREYEDIAVSPEWTPEMT